MENNCEFILKMDAREPDKIKNLVAKSEMKHVIEQLPIGDFVCDNICIERKEMGDLINSIRTGHLQKQLLQMEDSFEKCFLIISGNPKDIWMNPYLKGWTVNHHLGTLASLAVRYPRTKMIQVENDTQLVNIIPRIIEKCRDGKCMSKYDTELMRYKIDVEDIKLRMLMSIPRIGLEKAVAIATAVDVIIVKKGTKELITYNDLIKLNGIGDTIAAEVVNTNNTITKNEIKPKDDILIGKETPSKIF